jgi:hypothetical protein
MVFLNAKKWPRPEGGTRRRPVLAHFSAWLINNMEPLLQLDQLSLAQRAGKKVRFTSLDASDRCDVPLHV